MEVFVVVVVGVFDEEYLWCVGDEEVVLVG